MPEGDTIHSAARRVGAVLVGREIMAIETPQRRHAMDRWPERLAGRAVRAVDAHGKHLFIRFDGDLTLHSHLRMTGQWGVYGRGERWRRAPRRAWLVIRTADHEVVEFDGPVLELMTESRTRFDRRLAMLGPDVLAEDFDERGFLARLRQDDTSRGIGDALLDQRNLAGIGNVWKSEGCFLAGLDPWRGTGQVSDEEVLGVVRGIQPLMRMSVERGGRIVTYEPKRPSRGDIASRKRPALPDARGSLTWVFERTGLPCRRCGTLIRARGQGDDNRTTYWCPQCQT
ncbi:MAG TPA: DNA-formamidopyrimidine glycosylase family protein [Thermoleophilaceae bacterium]|nr:DNA-formamidopyrimidine glycosylase family protein [Thermoleophilaceae bacterium]